MSNSGRLLDNDEVEFLLHGGRGPSGRTAEQGESKPSRAEAPREVTMRGDLDKINLSDIFQTLAMSKMEGLLRIRGTLESREVYFHEGSIQVLLPRRVETLRLGQRLVRAGILSAEQIRFALLEQRKSRKNLADILIEQQLTSQEEVDEIVHNQVQEDLFALFTWPHGSFEFYKGAVTDTVLLDRLAQTPSFEVNGVLLEVARRSDEWHRVMDAVGSLEEILTLAQKVDPNALDDSQRLVMEAIDGRLSIRDIADTAMIPLFECGQVVRELLDLGLVRLLDMQEGIAAAAGLAESGEPRRAVTAVRALIDRSEARDLDTTKQLGELLARCGEQREAAAVLLAEARSSIDEGEAIELAKHARRLDQRSAEVLTFLANALRQSETADASEFADALTDLSDALADGGEHEDALSVIRELEELTEDLALCRPRTARSLAKLGRQDEAVEALMGLVDAFKAQGDTERVAATYEQILKIDHRRKDVAKLLKGLHAGKFVRRSKMAAIAAAAVALVLVGFVQVEQMMIDSEIASVRERFDAALSSHDFDSASALLQQASVEYGEHEQITAMRARIQSYERERAAKAKQELERIRSRMERDAAEMFATGRAAEALDLLDGLAQLGFATGTIQSTTRQALGTTRQAIVELESTLAPGLPPEPSIGQDLAQQNEILQKLDAVVESKEHAAATSLYELREDERLRSAFGKEHAKFVEEVEKLVEVLARVSELREAYSKGIERRDRALELTPLFYEARDHEKNHRYQAALEAYRTLASRHPDKGPLLQEFEERVERYSTILRFLDLVEQAAERGDFGAAQGQLRALKRQFPNEPFDRIARLPLRVRTTPAGARVSVDGKPVGSAPVVTSYIPAAKTRIRVELDGFQPEETVVTGDTIGIVQSLLARLPQWTVRRDTTVDRAPVGDSKGKVYVTDRTGTVSCLRESDGAILWSKATRDLSGLITGVTLAEEDALVFGSIDGPLRCLRRSNGEELWTVPDLPTESTPLIRNEVVVVATDDARAVGLYVKDGSVLWTTPLDGPVRADLVHSPKGTVVAVTSLGHAVGLDSRSGSVLWNTPVGQGVVSTPGVRDGETVVVAEDGEVTSIDLSDGKVRWRAKGFASLVLTPGITRDSVLIPDGRELHVLDRATGNRRRTIRGDEDLRTPVSVIGDLAFVGDARGVVSALGIDDLEPRFLLRADGPALAPVVRLTDGTLLGAFQDRTVRAFRPVR